MGAEAGDGKLADLIAKKIERMRELKAQGLSVRAIERELGVSRSAVGRYTKGRTGR